MKIGYARISSIGQNEAAQVDILNRNGIEELFLEKASGASRDGRPSLATAIKYARKGDVLVVTRLDRLARSVIGPPHDSAGAADTRASIWSQRSRT